MTSHPADWQDKCCYQKEASALVSVYRLSARNMSADPGVTRKTRPWHVRECHNCVIVPVAAAALRIINTCGYSGERGVILTSHKMEKTGKLIGRGGGGRLLLISCLCTETCFIKTLQPAVSLIFTDRAKGHKYRKEKPFSFLSFARLFTYWKPWSCTTSY